MRFFPLLMTLLLVAACRIEPVPSGTVQRQGAATPGLPRRVSVQFYLIYEAPSPTLTERKVETTSETIFLASRPDLTERDMAWAEMQVDSLSARASVLVHFTPIGADKLAALTKQNIGRRMAIMIDGRTLATPLITSEISDGRATIQGFKSASEAQRVADSLAQR